MKQLSAFIVVLLSASMLYAQDIITLRTGETINGKVSEAGINEVRYYKSSNLQGPVYVAAKTDARQIVYANGNKDIFCINTTKQYCNCIATGIPNNDSKAARSKKNYLEQQMVVPGCKYTY